MIKKARIEVRASLILWSIVGAGCMSAPSGPEWEDDSALAAHSEKLAITGAVVGDFYWVSSSSGANSGQGPTELRDVEGAIDVSAAIAESLRQCGIRARALPRGETESLKDREVLLRGIIRSRHELDQGGVRVIFGSLITGLTLGVIGGIIPLPFALREKVEIEYHVDGLSCWGETMLSTQGNVTGWYYYHKIFSWLENMNVEVKPETHEVTTTSKRKASVEDVKVPVINALCRAFEQGK